MRGNDKLDGSKGKDTCSGDAGKKDITRDSRARGQSPIEYLNAHYGHFFDGHPFQMPDPEQEAESTVVRSDVFSLHATILRQQLERMLASREASHDDEAVALAGLLGRVFDEPRGPWGAEDLASALGVSRTSLYRIVKRQHRTAPAKLVERLRMEAACRLLLESQHSLDVIADQVGYASAFSFSTAFKRVVGEPPSQFRIGEAGGAGRSSFGSNAFRGAGRGRPTRQPALVHDPR